MYTIEKKNCMIYSFTHFHRNCKSLSVPQKKKKKYDWENKKCNFYFIIHVFNGILQVKLIIRFIYIDQFIFYNKSIKICIIEFYIGLHYLIMFIFLVWALVTKYQINLF